MSVKVEDFKRMHLEDLNYGEKPKAVKEGKVASVKRAFKNMSVKDILGIEDNEDFVMYS